MNPAQLRNPAEARQLTVFYHGGCSDGITGAWAIYAALPDEVRARLAALGGIFAEGRGVIDPLEQLAQAGAVFHGISHAGPTPAPELVAGRHVVYVDVAPAAEVGEAVAAEARTLAVLDHHRSGKAAVEALADAAARRGLPCTAAYTEELSGAQIAWDWAHPGVPRPEFVDYVGDRDLWAFRLPGSRAANKALYVEGVTRGFGPLTDLHRSGGRVGADLAARGGAYMRYEEQIVARLAASARLATIASLPPGETEPREYCVRVVNTPVLQSEVGEAVMEKAGPEVHFAVTWAYAPDRDEIWASARTSRPDVDLSKIAPHIVGGRAGGGHPRAAGFTIAGDSIGAAVRWAAAPAGK